MLPILPPDRLVEVMEQRAKAADQPVLAFWYSVTGPRDEYAQSVRAARRRMPIVPLIPRRSGMFEAPNALVSDLVQLIDESKEIFAEADIDGWGTGEPLAVLILSRSPLAMPGGCSPTPLPDWFPRVGGTVVNMEIQDLTFSADAPLNCSEAAIPELCEALFTLEMALVSRLKASLVKEPSSCQAFLSMVATPKETPMDIILGWEKNAKAVKEPKGFRPSVKDGMCAVARLVGLFVKTTPDQLYSRGELVAKALRCDSAEDASFVSVLFRPTLRSKSAHAAFGRNLLITVYAGYQYVTAAAHADGYPKYPVSLIHALSRHLVCQLNLLTVALSVEGP